MRLTYYSTVSDCISEARYFTAALLNWIAITCNERFQNTLFDFSSNMVSARKLLTYFRLEPLPLNKLSQSGMCGTDLWMTHSSCAEKNYVFVFLCCITVSHITRAWSSINSFCKDFNSIFHKKLLNETRIIITLFWHLQMRNCDWCTFSSSLCDNVISNRD